MELKDYYSILELPPYATLPEIKKAYRRLAHQYHPDKNMDDKYAAAHFSVIKEAYEVLIHPSKKEQYLQQRWYNQSAGKKFSGNEPLTPATILKQCLELNRYVSKLDIHRMDKEGLREYIANLLTDSTVEQLNTYNEPAVNHQIILSILRTLEYIKMEQAKPITEKLSLLAVDEENKKLIIDFIHRNNKKENWEKYKFLVLIFATAIICLLIYLSSH